MPPTIASRIEATQKGLRPPKSLIAMVVSVALALVVTFWFARWGSRNLGNGFELVRDKQVRYVLGPAQPPTSSIDHQLATKTLVVPPNVTQLTQIGDIVTGLVEFKPACKESIQSDCGLFVIDTKSCECRLAMAQDQWEAWLRERGIDPATIRLPAP